MRYINIQNQPKLQDPLEETQETQEPMEVSQASVLVPAMTLEPLSAHETPMEETVDGKMWFLEC